MLTLALASIVLLWLLSNITAILRNYLIARKCNLPLVITPVNLDNLLWRIFSQPLKPWLEAYLPDVLYRPIRPCIYGWETKGTYAYHERVGKTFIIVGPGELECWTADPVVAQSVLSRWKNDFPTMPLTRQVMEFMGTNLLTSDGDVWARQRRLIAPHLNERISSMTWEETGKQSRAMTKHLQQQADGVSDETIEGLKAIALGVLSLVGYGQQQEWSIAELHNMANIDDPKRMGRAAVYSAVNVVIHNLLICAIIPSNILLKSFMPQFMQRLGKAKHFYPTWSKQMLEDERQLNAIEPRHNMASKLAQLSAKGSGAEKGGLNASSGYLTPEEINGNLFVFTAAGYETTANAMGFAVAFLAAKPQWQTWIQEELDEVFSDIKPDESGDYTEVFPRLQRTLALMLETLRLVPPLLHTTRATESQQIVDTPDGALVIPAKVRVYINNLGLQTNPAVWGADSYDFRPSRWLHETKDVKTMYTEASRRGYLPWSGGPRACPGMKMAQVEFVATMASLFRTMRVEPVLLGAESMADAQQRLLTAIHDSMPILTMQLPDSKVKLRWTLR